MNQQVTRYYEFGNFRLDVFRRLLHRNGEVVKLTPKAFDLILLLIRHKGVVLKKDRLMAELWPDVAVEENNLTQYISFLRKTLGDKLHNHKYIVTIPGQGYSFVGDVREILDAQENGTDGPLISSSSIDDVGNTPGIPEGAVVVAGEPPVRLKAKTVFAASQAKWKSHYLILTLLILSAVPLAAFNSLRWREPSSATRPSSIAVLPFKVLNDPNCNNPFGLKMADAVITRFGSDLSISVSPTNDISKYVCRNENLADIGRDLKVDFLLEGKIQNYDGNIRMTSQIIRVKDGQSVWTNKLDQSYTDCFAVQDGLSMELTQDLNKDLTNIMAKLRIEP